MRPSSSTSEPRPEDAPGGLLAPLFTDPSVESEIADAALLQAILEVERELAAAQASLGLIPSEAAEAIQNAASALRLDPADVGRLGVSAGNPIHPLVRSLTEAVHREARPFVHLGATSQDVLDTALVLLARRAGTRIVALLDEAAETLATLAQTSRGTVLAARTLGQQALPTTLGLKVAGWLTALGDGTERLVRVLGERLAVQFGGAAGTLAGLGDTGLPLLAALADRLELAEPVLPWHTDRQRVLDLGSALAGVVAAVGKVGQDAVLLAQTEVAEVVPATGGSSTAMPHKQNPVDAILVRSAAMRAPGLLATLYSTAALHEHERAAGAWHAEWETLRSLLSVTGGAAARLVELVSALRVQAAAMSSNLEMTGGLLLSESVAARLIPRLGRDRAHDVVAACARRAADSGVAFVDVVRADDAVLDVLDEAELAAALDPKAWLGAADALVDRALLAHQRRSHQRRRRGTR
jgi:3-carboxy-cis,cis-muconate cycloisomerase